MKLFNSVVLIPVVFFCYVSGSLAQEFNRDESKVRPYTLPLYFPDTSLSNKEKLKLWEEVKREEILQLFENEAYGAVPDFKYNVVYEVTEPYTPALDSLAYRKQTDIHIIIGSDTLTVALLLYVPLQSDKNYPVFFAYNYHGNHTVISDRCIHINDHFVWNKGMYGVFNNQPNELTRGIRNTRHPVIHILESGFAYCTVCNMDVEPDDKEAKEGIRTIVSNYLGRPYRANEWGAISAWSWFTSIVIDYFEQDSRIDQSRIAITGHSRLGKTALLTGARDKRVAITFANESGSSGASISRRNFGENIARMNNHFPHWMCDNYNKYNDNEDSLPFDQHMLLALIAPRFLYVASSSWDWWSDPKGELTSLHKASEIYKLYGLEGINTDELPDEYNPLISMPLGYHLRDGEHDLSVYDWQQFINFALKAFYQ
jgi:hypothetical protein